MLFVVGDKILFKKENMKGEIIRINSPYKVTVLSIEGFEIHVSVKDLVKIEKGTDKVTSYGQNLYSKDSNFKIQKSQKQQRSQKTLKVDLHIELLRSNYQYLDNFGSIGTSNISQNLLTEWLVETLRYLFLQRLELEL